MIKQLRFNEFIEILALLGVLALDPNSIFKNGPSLTFRMPAKSITTPSFLVAVFVTPIIPASLIPQYHVAVSRPR